MRSFRNNNRRSRYRSNGDRNFKRNGENHSFTSNENFQRKSPGRNNQNASKLIEKYTNLAKEALSSGDKMIIQAKLAAKIMINLKIKNQRKKPQHQINLKQL